MRRDLKKRIKQATKQSGIDKLDFLELLNLIDQHYDKMEATITQSLSSQSLSSQTLSTTTTPIEVIFDSVTEALLSVSEEGTIRNANKVCARYFGIETDELIGGSIVSILPESKGRTLADFLQPYQSNLDDTNIDFSGGEVVAARSDGDQQFTSAQRFEQAAHFGWRHSQHVGQLPLAANLVHRVQASNACLDSLQDPLGSTH